MNHKSIREALRNRRRKKVRINNLVWGELGIGFLALLGFLAWTAFRPAAGKAVPIMANSGVHVPAGSDPGPFNSDPPTSRRHYGQELEAGFYEESDPEVQYEFRRDSCFTTWNTATQYSGTTAIC